MLNASVDMLNHLGHNQHANAIADAIFETIVTDKIHTAGKFESFKGRDKVLQSKTNIIDLGGTASSTDVIQNVLKHLAEKHVSW
jgi:isocitrate dehydrogenase (NAD+)